MRGYPWAAPGYPACTAFRAARRPPANNSACSGELAVAAPLRPRYTSPGLERSRPWRQSCILALSARGPPDVWKCKLGPGRRPGVTINGAGTWSARARRTASPLDQLGRQWTLYLVAEQPRVGASAERR